jgi:hypothetical protein
MNLHGIVHVFIIEVRFPNDRNGGFRSFGTAVSNLPESRFPSPRNQGVIRAGIFTELFEEAFYKRKNLNPNVYGIHSQEPAPPKVTVPENIDPVLLQKVLSDPEMAALVSALAATMEKQEEYD